MGAFDTIASWTGNKDGGKQELASGKWCWCNDAGENCDCTDGEIIGSIKGKIMMRADGVFDTLVEWKGANDTAPVEKTELKSLHNGDEEGQDVDGTDDEEQHKSENHKDEEYVNEDSIGDNGGDTEEPSNRREHQLHDPTYHQHHEPGTKERSACSSTEETRAIVDLCRDCHVHGRYSV